MPTIKKIWRDNTMPPTNYVWMKTNLKGDLVGIYEWYNGEWRPIKTSEDGYTKEEVDLLIQAVQQTIIDGLANGRYRIGNIEFEIDGLDSRLYAEGTPGSGTVIATPDSSQDDTETVDPVRVLTKARMENGLLVGGTSVKIEGIPEDEVKSILGLDD